MRLLAASLLLAACTVERDGGDPPVPVEGELAGAITANQTWRGTVTLVADATIAGGVTVTIEPGTRFEGHQGATLRVAGTLDVAGTAAAPITMVPVAGALTWAGIVVDAGGRATLMHVHGDHVANLLYCHADTEGCVLDHVVFTDLGSALVTEDDARITASRITKMSNGGVTVSGGDVRIVDTYLLTSTGDIVIQNGGSLTIEHSEVGEAADSYEHCDLHINLADSLRITRSNIRAAVYGIMLGGTNGAVMQYNNFVENDPGNDISEVGENVAADLRFNYWDHGAPELGAGYDVSSPAAARIADAGPRTD